MALTDVFDSLRPEGTCFLGIGGVTDAESAAYAEGRIAKWR